MRFPRKTTGALLALLFAVSLGLAVQVLAASPPQLIPNDPGYRTAPGPLQQVHAPEAWAAVPCNPVIIAVIDSGVSPVGDLAGRVLPGWNAIDGSSSTADDFGHGTEVASVAAATVNNGIGVAGICGAAQILPVKVSNNHGATRADYIANGINWAAANGAKIINVSLFLDPGTSWPPLNAAIQNAVDRGITVTVLSGNNHSDDPSSNSIASANPEAIRVDGVDGNNSLYPQSNHGSWTDIAAPYIMSVDTLDGSTDIQGGTSFSTPMVVGAAAMLLSYNPNLTPAQVKTLLMSSGTKVPGLDDGCGCVLNVYGALEAAGYTQPVTTTTATTQQPMYKLTVKVTGKGSVACRPACGKPYTSGTVVSLSAKPKAGWRFARWSGGCAGTKLRCKAQLAVNLQVGARFALKPRKKR